MTNRHPAGTSTRLISRIPLALDESERLGRSAIISAGHRSLRAFTLAHPECSRDMVARGWRGDRISQRQANAFVHALGLDGIALAPETVERVFPRIVPDHEMPAPPAPPVEDAENDWGPEAS